MCDCDHFDDDQEPIGSCDNCGVNIYHDEWDAMNLSDDRGTDDAA